VEENVALFAVFDGHGGVMACDFACNMLLDAILDGLLAARRELHDRASALVTDRAASELLTCLEPALVNHIIVEGFVKCDEEIMHRELEKMEEGKRQQLPHVPSMPGSCAIVAVVVDGYLYVANLG
jgi:serine/threonine protein phosphatase PrpC